MGTGFQRKEEAWTPVPLPLPLPQLPAPQGADESNLCTSSYPLIPVPTPFLLAPASLPFFHCKILLNLMQGFQ